MNLSISQILQKKPKNQVLMYFVGMVVESQVMTRTELNSIF